MDHFQYQLFQKLLFIREDCFLHVFSDYCAIYLSKLVSGEMQLFLSWKLVLVENDVHFPSLVLYTIKVSVLKQKNGRSDKNAYITRPWAARVQWNHAAPLAPFTSAWREQFRFPKIVDSGSCKVIAYQPPNKKYMLKYDLAPAVKGCVNGKHAHTLIFKSCWQKSEISKDLLDRKKGSAINSNRIVHTCQINRWHPSEMDGGCAFTLNIWLPQLWHLWLYQYSKDNKGCASTNTFDGHRPADAIGRPHSLFHSMNMSYATCNFLFLWATKAENTIQLFHGEHKNPVWQEPGMTSSQLAWHER